MSSFIKSAIFTYDVESDLEYVEFKYSQWVSSANQYEDRIDYLQTRPVGNWTEIQALRRNLSYEKFLDTMVEQTDEVIRRKVSASVEAVYEQNTDNLEMKLWLMNCMKILDPSFEPPYINKKAVWQRELVDWILTDTIHDLIERCRNLRRLERLYHITKLIELESK